MSKTEDNKDFFAEFIDDYYAECEEHLTVVRRNLLALEPMVHHPVERTLVEELFRSFHSLKGLSGMVGVKEAEQVAHHMESYLRSLRDGVVLLEPEGIDALIEGTKMLEGAIAAHRSKNPAPDISEAITQLTAILSEESSPTPRTPDAGLRTPDSPTLPPVKLKPEERDRLADAVKSGVLCWRFEFVPGAALAERGVNVNNIRDRLQAIGELIHASPRVTKNGGIVFDFVVASQEGSEATFTEWVRDGVTFTPYSEEEVGEQGSRGAQEQGSRGAQEQGSKGAQEQGSRGAQEQGRPEVGSVEFARPEQGRPEVGSVEFARPELGVQTEDVASVQESEVSRGDPPGVFDSEATNSSGSPQKESGTPTPDLPILPSSVTSRTISAANSPAPSNVVRVDLARLDELMRMVGELTIARARLEDNLKSLKGSVTDRQLRPLKEINLTFERQLRDLREGVMRVRMVPIGEIFARMQFVIRDLVRESQKQISLELSGQGTEIDKFVVERMMDPLLHLVRNAVSHGLEPESERVAKGKSPEGKISLRAFTSGEMVTIEIEDDGRGVDVETVVKRARSQGLIDLEVQPDAATILDILCLSGFSTREQADLTSGRGVGMAVVKNTVLELGGFLTLESAVGTGTRFTIQLPLTLAIADAMIVSLGGQTFAVPQSSVREVLQIQPTAVIVLENNEIFSHRDSVLPLIRLARLFGLAETAVPPTKFLQVVVIGSGLNAIGILVDRIFGLREIVVRPLTDPLVQVTGIAGATELGDRRVVLILDTAALLQVARLANCQGGKLGTTRILNARALDARLNSQFQIPNSPPGVS